MENVLKEPRKKVYKSKPKSYYTTKKLLAFRYGQLNSILNPMLNPLNNATNNNRGLASDTQIVNAVNEYMGEDVLSVTTFWQIKNEETMASPYVTEGICRTFGISRDWFADLEHDEPFQKLPYMELKKKYNEEVEKNKKNKLELIDKDNTIQGMAQIMTKLSSKDKVVIGGKQQPINNSSLSAIAQINRGNN